MEQEGQNMYKWENVHVFISSTFNDMHTGLLFYVAAVYFTSSYCYAYGKLSQMAVSEIIVRAFRFSFILGILLLEFRLLSYYICYLRSKGKRDCELEA